MKNHLTDISYANSIEDIDMLQMLYHLRHEFLETAKDLTKDSRDLGDIKFGEDACDNALLIQSILEQ